MNAFEHIPTEHLDLRQNFHHIHRHQNASLSPTPSSLPSFYRLPASHHHVARFVGVVRPGHKRRGSPHDANHASGPGRPGREKYSEVSELSSEFRHQVTDRVEPDDQRAVTVRRVPFIASYGFRP